MKFKFKESDIQMLEAASGHSRAQILNNIAGTIEEIGRLYKNHIRPFGHGDVNNSRGYRLHFRRCRSYRLPGRSKGIPVNYTLFYDDKSNSELICFVSTRRSQWSELTDAREVFDAYATETMDDILMSKE